MLEAVGHFVGWSASIGADWPVVALELFLQVVIGIHASGCHTRTECIDVNVVSVAVTEALHSVDTTESVFSLEEWRDVLRYESGKLLKWPSGRGFCRRSSGVPS